MNQFDRVQAVDRFCQGVVVAIVFAVHKGLCPPWPGVRRSGSTQLERTDALIYHPNSGA